MTDNYFYLIFRCQQYKNANIANSVYNGKSRTCCVNKVHVIQNIINIFYYMKDNTKQL